MSPSRIFASVGIKEAFISLLESISPLTTMLSLVVLIVLVTELEVSTIV